jgi:hypothetical protein
MQAARGAVAVFERRLATSSEIDEFLSRLSDDLSPLRDLARAAIELGAWIDRDSGALLLGHAPAKATEAFDICLFPPLSYQKSQGILPLALRLLLTRLNGANLFELRIFGEIDALNRGVRQPLELGMGAIWSVGYEGSQEDEVLFASQNVSWTGQVGYFIRPSGEIIGRGNGNEVPASFLQTWPDFKTWATAVLVPNRLAEPRN